MCVVPLGSNLGKAKGQISLMQNLDQNIESWHNFYVRRGKAKTYFFFIIACEDIRRSSWVVAKRVQFLSGPWPYHTTAHIPNQVVQLRESQSER